jgi:TetR/AcrR family transcriptional repressor of nem operon
LRVVNERRTQILDAASVLIYRNGFHQTSIEDVIKEAGLSGKAHFYHYYKSKEELGYAVLNHQFERFAQRSLAVLREPSVDPLERLDNFIDALIAGHAERGCQGGCPFGNLVAEMADAHEGFRKRLETVFEHWANYLYSLLWEARPQLEDDVDISRLARFIIATIEGAWLMSRVKRDIGVMEEIAADLKHYVVSHTRRAELAADGA